MIDKGEYIEVEKRLFGKRIKLFVKESVSNEYKYTLRLVPVLFPSPKSSLKVKNKFTKNKLPINHIISK